MYPNRKVVMPVKHRPAAPFSIVSLENEGHAAVIVLSACICQDDWCGYSKYVSFDELVIGGRHE